MRACRTLQAFVASEGPGGCSPCASCGLPERGGRQLQSPFFLSCLMRISRRFVTMIVFFIWPASHIAPCRSFIFPWMSLPKTNLVSSAPGARGETRRRAGFRLCSTARAPGLARRNFPTFFQLHPPCLWQESVHAEVLGGCMSIRTNVIGSLQGRFASPSSRT